MRTLSTSSPLSSSSPLSLPFNVANLFPFWFLLPSPGVSRLTALTEALGKRRFWRCTPWYCPLAMLRWSCSSCLWNIKSGVIQCKGGGHIDVGHDVWKYFPGVCRPDLPDLWQGWKRQHRLQGGDNLHVKPQYFGEIYPHILGTAIGNNGIDNDDSDYYPGSWGWWWQSCHRY